MFYKFNKVLYLSVTLTCVFGMNICAFAQNTCRCPNPPGGALRCDDDQVGFCNVQNGNINAECIKPPLNIRKKKVLYSWILTILLSQNIKPEMISKSEKLQRILNTQHYIDKKTGIETFFTLPSHFD